MKIIDKGNYKNFIERGILKIQSFTRVELAGVDYLRINASNDNEIIVGDSCSIYCDDNNHINVKHRCMIAAKNNCIINGGDYNEIGVDQNCKITVDDLNTVIARGYNAVRGGHFNTITVEDNSDIIINNEGIVTIKGRNINLKILDEGALSTINNLATSSVILTYNAMGTMKIYKTSKLKQNEISVSNGKISKEFNISMR